VNGFCPLTADISKKGRKFSKEKCLSIRLNVRFATCASLMHRCIKLQNKESCELFTFTAMESEF